MRTQPRRRRPQKTIALLVQPASAAAGVRIFTGGGLDLLRSRLGPGSVRQLPMIKGLALCDSASIRIPVSMTDLSYGPGSVDSASAFGKVGDAALTCVEIKDAINNR